MKSQQNKKEVVGVVLQATPTTAANNSSANYPPPPGYRIVYHVTKEIGDEMAIFTAPHTARVYGEWLVQGAALAASSQNSITPSVKQEPKIA